MAGASGDSTFSDVSEQARGCSWMRGCGWQLGVSSRACRGISRSEHGLLRRERRNEIACWEIPRQARDDSWSARAASQRKRTFRGKMNGARLELIADGRRPDFRAQREAICTSFKRLEAPVLIATTDFRQPKCSAISAINSAFAFPSTGGDFRRARKDRRSIPPARWRAHSVLPLPGS